MHALLEDFRHPSGKGFRVPAGDGEKAILQAALDRIYPAWTDRTWGELKDKFQVPTATGLEGGRPLQFETVRLSELLLTSRSPLPSESRCIAWLLRRVKELKSLTLKGPSKQLQDLANHTRQLPMRGGPFRTLWRSHCEFWHLFCGELGALAPAPGKQDIFVQAVECWVPILGELFDIYVEKE
eukprot:8289969-Pyramimonas_sp.AAC.1